MKHKRYKTEEDEIIQKSHKNEIPNLAIQFGRTACAIEARRNSLRSNEIGVGSNKTRYFEKPNSKPVVNRFDRPSWFNEDASLLGRR